MPPQPQQQQNASASQQVEVSKPPEIASSPSQPVALRKALQILERGAPNLNNLESDEAKLAQIIKDIPHGASRETLANFAKSQSASGVLQAIKGELLYEAGGVLTYKWKMHYQSTTSQFVQNAMNKLITSGVIDEQKFVKQQESVTLDQALGSLYYQKRAESFAGIKTATSKSREEERQKQEMIKGTYNTTAAYFNPQHIDQEKVDSIKVAGPSKVTDVTTYTKAEVTWVTEHAQGAVSQSAQVAARRSGVKFDTSLTSSGGNQAADATRRISASPGVSPKAAIDPLSSRATSTDQARALYNKELAGDPKDTVKLARDLVAKESPEGLEALKGTLSNALSKTTDAKQKNAIEASLKAVQIAEVEKKISDTVNQKGDILHLVDDLDRLGGAKAVASFLYRQQEAGNLGVVAEVMEASGSNSTDRHQRLLVLFNEATEGSGKKLSDKQLAILSKIRNSLAA